MKLIKGGSIGDIYGKAFVRDDAGNIVYETEGDNKGLPLVEGDGNTVKVGNANPVFMMGWDHTFSYKGFTLYFLRLIGVTEAKSFRRRRRKWIFMGIRNNG